MVIYEFNKKYCPMCDALGILHQELNAFPIKDKSEMMCDHIIHVSNIDEVNNTLKNYFENTFDVPYEISFTDDNFKNFSFKISKEQKEYLMKIKAIVDKDVYYNESF